jgi:pyruvate/2-oxoglutarate dehydrogenase complex dihydrolipoamide acyltransferase (E2) component
MAHGPAGEPLSGARQSPTQGGYPKQNIVIRSMMNLCLNFDYRTIERMEADTFVAGVRRRLEAMGREMGV